MPFIQFSWGVQVFTLSAASATARGAPHLTTFLLSLVKVRLSSWVDGRF